MGSGMARHAILFMAVTLIFSTVAPAIAPSVLSDAPDRFSEAQAGYYINGTVYLYNGNDEGTYLPFWSYSGTTVYISWFDTGIGSFKTITTSTNVIGQFSAEIANFTDNSIVELKAQFEAPFFNWGHNYTLINLTEHPVGTVQDIVCGVPYEVVYNPTLPGVVLGGAPLSVTYRVLDRDGTLCTGYYSFNDGNMDFSSSDPLFINECNHPLLFDGIGGDVSDGQYSGSVTFFTNGNIFLNISEGGQAESNPYLTPWGNFNQIIEGVTTPGWKDDWETCTVFCVGGGRIWWDLKYGWNLVSLPVNPRSFYYGSNGLFDSYDTLNIIWETNGDPNLRMLNRLPGIQPTYAVFDYGQPESAAFAMDGVHSYWVWTEAATYVMFYGQNWTSTNQINLNIGWNVLGFPHSYPYWSYVPTASDFTDGTIDPDLNIYGTNQKIIASQWNAVTQKFISYAVTDTFPGIESKDWQWDFSVFSFPGNGLMLWTDEADQITFPFLFSETPGPGICSSPSQTPQPFVSPESEEIRATSRDVPPGDPYPVFGYVVDNFTLGPGYDVYVEWTDQGGAVIPAAPLHEVTNNYGQYSVDLFNHVGGSLVWANASKAGFSGHNSTTVNMAENAGKKVDIWNDLPSPEMIIDKTGPTYANSGEAITYWINYTNIGFGTAYDVVVTETYPAGVTFVSSVPLPTFGDNGWIIGSIAPGGSGSIAVTVLVNPTTIGTLLNSVVLNYQDGGGVSQPQVSDMCSTVIVDPYIAITKTAPPLASPGQFILYTITYENIGTDTAFNVVVTDYYPVGVIFISAVPLPSIGNNVWNLGSIPPGGSGSISITVQISNNASGVLTNWAYIDYEDFTGSPMPVTWAYANTTIGGPSMIVQKTGSMTINPGQTFLYTIMYRNIGVGVARNVLIEDIWPTGLTYISSNPAGSIVDIPNRRITWIISDVYPSSIYNLTVTFQATGVSMGNVLTNWVFLNYTDNAGIPQPTKQDSHTTLVVDALLLITKSGPATASPGDTIVYWLNYSNAGTDWAYDVSITDTYPPGISFISSMPAPSIGNNIWVIGALAPGASGSVQITVQVNLGTSGNITNYVQLDYWNSVAPLPPVYASCLTVIGGSDTLPPQHLNEHPPINGASFNLTPVISVDVTDISGVNASTIRLYVGGFMIFYSLAAIPDGYTVSYWHEAGFTEGQNVSCRIVAKDYLGNALDFTWFFTAAIGESFIINLHDGWNLLSFSLIPLDTSIENLLFSVSGNWDVAKWYDPGDPSDPWKTYRPGSPSNDLNLIDNTMGFWLHVTNSSSDLIIYGIEPATTNIMLKAGWNLVSYPSSSPNTVSTALWGTGADRVEAYDNSSSTLLRELGPGELMEPGQGYWVHVPTDSVWIVDW